MAQSDHIKNIAKYGLENDRENLFKELQELIEYSKQHNKLNFAIQLQSILKNAIKQQQDNGLVKVGSPKYLVREEEKELNDFIIEKITSDYKFDNLVCSDPVKQELTYFIEEHRSIQLLRRFELPVSNRVMFHGPSGCGKTLAAYVLAGELNKLMFVVNLGAIVSSKLGETSKNLVKVFRRAAQEGSIIFIDEFDSLGKVRDYSQDHGEMKRVVNTILQLFDYLPQTSMIIAATNHLDMIDDALLRRFDLNLKFDLPDEEHIHEIISKTLANNKFAFDSENKLAFIIEQCKGLSYYSIQKTLLTSIKRSLFKQSNKLKVKPIIDTNMWIKLISQEQKR